MKATIYFAGEKRAGINPTSFVAEVPDPQDAEHRRAIKDALAECYDDITGESCFTIWLEDEHPLDQVAP